MFAFVKAYVKSMRLYYAFVTGIAGWLGLAFYEYAAESGGMVPENTPGITRKFVILMLLFLSWGINQIINDYLGLKEDRINAPNRPMVTGELEPKKALMLSGILMLISMAITWGYLEPIAIIPEIIGILLNILYEYAKGYNILGNLVFGLMISMCSVIGFLAAGPVYSFYITSNSISIFILVVMINGLMTFYTFFKDYEGDRAAGKNTVVVLFGLQKSRLIALTAALLPTVTFAVLYSAGLVHFTLNNTFAVLALITVFLQIWTGVLYYKYPSGEKTYYSLKTNFRACSCGQAALIALFDKELAMILFIITYILVGFLFDLHSNSKA